MSKTGRMMFVALGLLPMLAMAQDKPVVFSTKAGKMKYRISHPAHQSEATSVQAEVKVQLAPDGTTKVMGRVPVASFKSDSDNRDEHMREVVNADKFPMASFKGTGKVARPAGAGTVRATLQGELEFHGIRHPLEIPVEISFASPDKAHVTSNFGFSLDTYEIDRPSLLLVKIDDLCKMEADFDVALEGG
jgi:polyisoprenoid-binding protein YceI